MDAVFFKWQLVLKLKEMKLNGYLRLNFALNLFLLSLQSDSLDLIKSVTLCLETKG